MPLKRYIRKRRHVILNDYIIFFQEHEVGIGMVKDEPINFHQAIKISNLQRWINAMNEEIKSMSDNDIWDLVPLPKGGKSIGCK